MTFDLPKALKDVAIVLTADDPLTAESEKQMCRLAREYTGDGEFLAVHHPAEADAHDDAPDATALALIAASGGFVGDIVLL